MNFEINNSRTKIVVLPQPLLPLPPDSAGDMSHAPELPLCSISPKELYVLLTQQPDLVLVMDCRPRAEYLASHPDTKKKFPQWLCVPEETVRKG